VGYALLVGKELIDVLAVSLEQILAILGSSDRCFEFIRTERKNEADKTIEVDALLQISALGGNR
jgi:hypothetical protein